MVDLPVCDFAIPFDFDIGPLAWICPWRWTHIGSRLGLSVWMWVFVGDPLLVTELFVIEDLCTVS